MRLSSGDMTKWDVLCRAHLSMKSSEDQAPVKVRPKLDETTCMRKTNLPIKTGSAWVLIVPVERGSIGHLRDVIIVPDDAIRESVVNPAQLDRDGSCILFRKGEQLAFTAAVGSVTCLQ